MINVRAAQRYALAIFRVTEEQNITDSVSRDFELIQRAIRESHDFFLFLRSPVINTERKKHVFAILFEGKISDLTLRFIILLTTKNREGLLSDIIDQYAVLRDRQRGILNITVQTAVRLTSEQEKDFTSQMGDTTGKNVRMTFTVDPALRGGFTVHYDDTVVDASIQHQLDLLRLKLTEKVS